MAQVVTAQRVLALIAIAGVSAALLWLDHRIDHVEAAAKEASDDAASSEPAPVRRASSTATLFGKQGYGAFGSETVQAQDKTYIAGDACAALSPLLPAPAVGEHLTVTSLAKIDYAGGDAAVNCDGGACTGDFRRYFPGVYQGGQFCRGDGVCTDVQTDVYLSADAATPLFGSTVHITWQDAGIVAEAGTLATQVCCASPCWAAAITTADRGLANDGG